MIHQKFLKSFSPSSLCWTFPQTFSSLGYKQFLKVLTSLNVPSFNIRQGQVLTLQLPNGIQWFFFFFKDYFLKITTYDKDKFSCPTELTILEMPLKDLRDFSRDFGELETKILMEPSIRVRFALCIAFRFFIIFSKRITFFF